MASRFCWATCASIGFSLSLGGCAGDDMGGSDSATTTATATAGETETTSSETDSSSSTGDTESSTGSTGSTGSTSGGPVDYVADIQPIWDSRCVDGCHTPGGSQPGIPLDPDVSYGTLVGKPSVQLPSMNIVEPGDPDTSYLWHKLNNTQVDAGGSGGSMPLGSMLPADELAKVKTWISGGAEM
ncbi:MAG TPA: hypothetical protein ENJ18_12730 [Nannocystis exedens]|nr:hypothetical protein [Nannocystis exedens]